MYDPFETESLLVMGKEVEVKYFYDDDISPFDYDTYGLVSEWTTRNKRPGERVLCRDSAGHIQRLYDWQAACKLARKDGWDAKPYGALNRIERAVKKDFDFLKAWCDNEWHYAGVVVQCAGQQHSLWGVETYDNYYRQCAAEMAEDLVGDVIHEEQEVEYWNARDVITKEDA